jgi:hypothetical protein
MVLIFLSGAPLKTATKLYVNNILNTLFLPTGSQNRYRFTCSGADSNVDPQLPRCLREIAKRRWRKEHAMLVFVDRYAHGGYEFRPLRLGRLKNVSLDGDRLFCDVELNDYVVVKGDFKQWLAKEASDKNYPHLIDADPDNTNDGYYVIHVPAKLKKSSIAAGGDQAWTEHVNALANTRRFQAPTDHKFFFFRADVPRRRGGGKPFKARNGLFRIPSNTKFESTLSYRWPFAAASIPNAAFKINRSEPLKGDLDRIQIASPGDAKVINYRTARYPQEDEMKIDLTGDPDQNLFRPDAPIRFQIGFSQRQLILAIITLCIIAFGSVIGASEHDCGIDLWCVINNVNWVKFGGEILKLCGFVAFFRIFGRQILSG